MVQFNTFTYDVETTGVNTSEDRIVEISWILLDEQLERIKSHTQLINPQTTIPQEAIDIHGIRNSDVIDQPTFQAYFQEVISPIFMEYDPMLGGFNSKRFDDEMFQNELKRCGIELPVTEMYSLDVGALYKKLQPRTLEACAKEYLGEERIEKIKQWFLEHREQRGEGDDVFHTAEFDTVLTAHITREMFQRHELPTEAQQLNEYIHKMDESYIDLDGKFQFKDGVPIVAFGKKHNGKTLQEVAEKHSGYLQWMLKNNFSTQVKDICRNALQGIYPEPQDAQ